LISYSSAVVLLNVEPSMVPSDLRDRPLTEAARAIVRGGDRELVDAIRKVSPKLFGDYARTLPPTEKEPSLVSRAAPGQVVTVVAPQLMRLNRSVTDRNGRAIGGMSEADFSVRKTESNGGSQTLLQLTSRSTWCSCLTCPEVWKSGLILFAKPRAIFLKLRARRSHFDYQLSRRHSGDFRLHDRPAPALKEA
jgi:hypothetical protein